MESFRLFFPAFLTILYLQWNLCAAQNFFRGNCVGGNYTATSKFESNLKLLITSISSNTSLRNTRFFSISAGKDPDSVYALFQCRGDFSLEDCSRCAGKAAEEIMERCPYSKQSILFYDECSLQYSGKSFVSTVQYNPSFDTWVLRTVSNPDLFSTRRAQLMERLASQAVSNSGNMFATGEENLTSSEKIYGLVQCRQDINRNDCNRCLTMAVSELPICCDKSMGGRSVNPSCTAWYDSYEFFQTNVVTPSPRNATGKANGSSSKIVVIVVPSVATALLLFIITLYLFLKRKKGFQVVKDVDTISTAETLQFNFAMVVAATENFSDANWLGEGGFGTVYKGKLSDGQEIAVKRLSNSSRQYVVEFKTEALQLAKLRHRNLVKLLGCCEEASEKLLIYEYVPNRSLDEFLFDQTKRAHLDWEKRYQIIRGVARGLLYLHEDFRETVIHRDLKASNVLLDAQMNPKIADFGLARLFVADQTHGSSRHVVQTDASGYMAPEYARHGNFTAKTDVFSFGVLVIEIVSGRRNNRSYELEHAEDLLSKARRLWRDGITAELVDPTLGGHYSRSEVMKCIHTGLICVEGYAARRPTMASVVLMLNNYSVTLPLPSAPVDSVSGESEVNATSSSEPISQEQARSSSIAFSVNEASITELEPR